MEQRRDNDTLHARFDARCPGREPTLSCQATWSSFDVFPCIIRIVPESARNNGGTTRHAFLSHLLKQKDIGVQVSVCSYVRPFVRPSIRQHLTWVSCERNSSYSFAPIVLKLCMCFPHGMMMCMWIGHSCWINFCHFFDIVNLVIFHTDYIDRGYLL